MLDGLVFSFFSQRFYYNQAHKYRGIGMGLIFLLTCIMILALAPWKIEADISQMVKKIPEIAEKLPAITYKDRKLSIDKPVPWYLDSGPIPQKAIIMIDTSYRVTDIDALTQFMRNNRVAVLLTQDKMVVLKQAGIDNTDNSLEIRDLKSIGKDFVITHQDWQKYASMCQKWGTTLIVGAAFSLLFIVFFIGNILFTLGTAIVIKILGLVMSAGFDFSGAMRLAAAARIPAVVLQQGLVWAKMGSSAGWISWGIWCVYILFAVYASKREHIGTAAG